MLQDTKNKETISILNRLKQQGPPTTEPAASLDMTLPKLGEADETDTSAAAAAALAKKKKPVPPAGGAGPFGGGGSTPPTMTSGSY